MNRRAFTLIELITVIAVFAALAALLVVSSHRTRQTGQLNESLNNLKTIGSTMGMYQTDFQDFIPMFSWHGGEAPPANDVPADLVAQASSGDDFAAASAQAVWFMRRISGQPALAALNPWAPHHLYWWLSLADYAKWTSTTGPVVSPADVNRLRWIRNPVAFLNGQIQPAPDFLEYRWLYSSSYVPTVPLYSADRGDAPNHGSLRFAGRHFVFQFTNSTMGVRVLGRRRATEIVFPSQKITITDGAQRHFGTERYVLHSDARAVALAGDGAASVRATAKYNFGFDVGLPSSGFPQTISYEPQGWEPPPRLGPGNTVNASVLSTRGGLQGRDFGGREIDTSTWR